MLVRRHGQLDLDDLLADARTTDWRVLFDRCATDEQRHATQLAMADRIERDIPLSLGF